MNTLDRLRRVQAVTHLPGDPEPVHSWSNDVWLLDDRVLRICWRGDRDRLMREAEILPHLPPEVRAPTLESHGRDDELSWTVSRRMPGACLDDVWPAMQPPERRRAVHQLAACLEALHTWPVPSAVRSTLATAPGLVQLPIPPHLLALAPQTAREDMARLAGPVADAQAVLVHGDLHFGNVLWHDEMISAVLDFEWLSLGAPDQDLEPFLRNTAWLGDEGDPCLLTEEDLTTVLTWLQEQYPKLFAHEQLPARLRLYQLAYTLRDLHVRGRSPHAEKMLKHLLRPEDSAGRPGSPARSSSGTRHR